MRIGLIARMDSIGLGTQTWELFRHLNPEKTLIVNSEKCNGNKQYPERFQGRGVKQARTVPFRVDVKKESILEFCHNLDVIITCETPYNYYLFDLAKRRRCKTVLQFNWEFLDYLDRPFLAKPDCLASPSYWHLQEAQERFGAKHLPVPVNRKVLPFTKKTRFKEFLHLAGIRVDHDRNGTEQTILAASQVPEINLTVKVQNEGWAAQWQKDFNFPNVKIIGRNIENYYDNYTGYDALIFPRKYGGLCLPMQEALSCGMPVIMTNCSPNDEMLPPEWLVESEVNGTFPSRGYAIEINTAKIDNLADKIKWLAGLNEADAAKESEHADYLASELSWDIWKDKYIEFFKSI